MLAEFTETPPTESRKASYADDVQDSLGCPCPSVAHSAHSNTFLNRPVTNDGKQVVHFGHLATSHRFALQGRVLAGQEFSQVGSWVTVLF